MKRSEFIEKLKNELTQRWGYDDSLDYSQLYTILDIVEELGMSPPCISTNASGWEIGKGASAYTPEWESEDEPGFEWGNNE